MWVQVIMRASQEEGHAEEGVGFFTPTKIAPAPKRAGRVDMSKRAPPPTPTPKNAVPVTADGAGRLAASLKWVHAGPHLVWVTVDGEAIVGSPLTIQVGPTSQREKSSGRIRQVSLHGEVYGCRVAGSGVQMLN